MTPYIAHVRAHDGMQQSLEAHLTGVADLCALLAHKIGMARSGELIGLMHMV